MIDLVFSQARTDNAVDDAVQKSVEWAIDAGYRHIDTAYIYFIEDQVTLRIL